jgi:hypothetical protein
MCVALQRQSCWMVYKLTIVPSKRLRRKIYYPWNDRLKKFPLKNMFFFTGAGVKLRHSLETNKYPYVSPTTVQIPISKADLTHTARYPLVKAHGLYHYPLSQSSLYWGLSLLAEIRSLNFTVTRVLMNIFCTYSDALIRECQNYFDLPAADTPVKKGP